MKKKLKGFTLIEVIIALAVFTIMALMLSMMYTAACALRLRTNGMNQKIDQQAVAVEAGIIPGDQISGPYTIQFGGAASFNVDVYQKDKSSYDTAKAKTSENRDQDEKALVDSPNIIYFHN